MDKGKRPQLTITDDEVRGVRDYGRVLGALLAAKQVTRADIVALETTADAVTLAGGDRARNAFLAALIGPDLADDVAATPEVRAWVRRYFGMPARRGIARAVPRGLRELRAGLTRAVWRAKQAVRLRQPLNVAELRAAAETELFGGPRRDCLPRAQVENLISDLIGVAKRRGRVFFEPEAQPQDEPEARAADDADKPSRLASDVIAVWIGRRYGARGGRAIERRIAESAPAVALTSTLDDDADLAALSVVTRDGRKES